MKKLILTLFLIAVSLSFSQTPQELFEKANGHYANKEYSTAIDIYESLINQGYENADVYYNLGSAYYRINSIPYSILYLEKANKLKPGDEDISFNLRIANLQIIDKIEPLPKLFYQEWLDYLTNDVKSSDWALYSIVLSFIAVILMVIFILSNNFVVKKSSFAISILTFMLFMFTLSVGIKTKSNEVNINDAIIFDVSVYVKSSPDDAGKDLFILHEGTKVRILKEMNNWTEIKIENGNVGWLPTSSYIEI